MSVVWWLLGTVSGVSMLLRTQIGVLLLDDTWNMDRCLVLKHGLHQNSYLQTSYSFVNSFSHELYLFSKKFLILLAAFPDNIWRIPGQVLPHLENFHIQDRYFPIWSTCTSRTGTFPSAPVFSPCDKSMADPKNWNNIAVSSTLHSMNIWDCTPPKVDQ